MNCVAPSSSGIVSVELFNAAAAKAAEWRGRCLDHLSRMEAAVTESLASMARVERRGGTAQLSFLVGQRMDRLAAAIMHGGRFEAEGHDAQAALTRCRDFADLRAMLCHGTGKITLDFRGNWTLVLRLVSPRGGRTTRQSMAFTEREAASQLEDLNDAQADLCSRLGQVRARLR